MIRSVSVDKSRQNMTRKYCADRIKGRLDLFVMKDDGLCMLFSYFDLPGVSWEHLRSYLAPGSN